MNDPKSWSEYRTAFVTKIREVRRRFDDSPRGDTASIRRCKAEEDVALDGTFWRIGGDLARTSARWQVRLSHVVLLFPLARQRAHEKFSFGRFLNRHLGDSDAARIRFRRLMESRDPDELVHRMRAMLRLSCGQSDAPVDWGNLGFELMNFFSEGGHVRRGWAQDFYAPFAKPESPQPNITEQETP